MGQWFETTRGVVFPWHCDHIGHMNVRWYGHFFDDGGFHIWSAAGIGQHGMREQGAQVVVARTTNSFLSEVKAGALIVIYGGFTRVGNKSIAHLQKMYDADTNKLFATQETIEVFFDLKARTSARMPDYVRDVLEPLVVDPESDPEQLE